MPPVSPVATPLHTQAVPSSVETDRQTDRDRASDTDSEIVGADVKSVDDAVMTQHVGERRRRRHRTQVATDIDTRQRPVT